MTTIQRHCQLLSDPRRQARAFVLAGLFRALQIAEQLQAKLTGAGWKQRDKWKKPPTLNRVEFARGATDSAPTKARPDGSRLCRGFCAPNGTPAG